MELRHLRYFTAVVQWKGYREASRRLHVAQPAISQTVADLEEELGLKQLVILFNFLFADQPGATHIPS
jgi:DNA-binding transcriptional LysR family regulator